MAVAVGAAEGSVCTGVALAAGVAVSAGRAVSVAVGDAAARVSVAVTTRVGVDSIRLVLVAVACVATFAVSRGTGVDDATGATVRPGSGVGVSLAVGEGTQVDVGRAVAVQLGSGVGVSLAVGAGVHVSVGAGVWVGGRQICSSGIIAGGSAPQLQPSTLLGLTI